LAERGFEVLEEWWRTTLEAIRTCPCEAGCPSCIHSPKCGNNNEPLDKEAAILLLSGLSETGNGT
jgi:DEAD/DEAH box helicase domain-containing protein